MTLKEFHVEMRRRYIRTFIASIVFLLILVPFCIWGYEGTRALGLTTILSVFAGGTVASWAFYSELKKMAS